VIATGESQSASRLVTYVNAVHPLAHVYDGYMIHSRGGGGSALSQPPLPQVSPPSPLLIRDDLDVPVFVVQAEGDVLGSYVGARQPDTATFRSWELAGTSHADSYTAGVGFGDIGDGNGAVQMLAFLRTPQEIACDHPINAGPHHWQLQAAFHALDAWVRDGTPPPIAPRLEVVSTSPTVLARDFFGNALGGVRSPHVDAPLATLGGINSGSGLCRLFGTTTPFSSQARHTLYPTHEVFVTAWANALADAVAGGFLLQPDADELLAAAEASAFPD
jgi:hypothetical protein